MTLDWRVPFEGWELPIGSQRQKRRFFPAHNLFRHTVSCQESVILEKHNYGVLEIKRSAGEIRA